MKSNLSTVDEQQLPVEINNQCINCRFHITRWEENDDASLGIEILHNCRNPVTSEFNHVIGRYVEQNCYQVRGSFGCCSYYTPSKWKRLKSRIGELFLKGVLWMITVLGR